MAFIPAILYKDSSKEAAMPEEEKIEEEEEEEEVEEVVAAAAAAADEEEAAEFQGANDEDVTPPFLEGESFWDRIDHFVICAYCPNKIPYKIL
jgi:hypothetical protein